MQIVLDAIAGELSAELARQGIAAGTRVHVVVDILEASDPAMAAIGQAGQGLDWLADEPDLYADADARASEAETLVDVARRVFGPAGVELDLPPRSGATQRPPPDFSQAEPDL